MKGLDLLFIGAADLFVSYNLPHQVTHPTDRSDIKTVFEKSNKAGMKVGVPAYDAVQAKEVENLGASPPKQTLKAHLHSVKTK